MKRAAVWILILLLCLSCCAEGRKATVLEEARVRSEANTNSEILTRLKPGSEVTILAYGEEWCRIEAAVPAASPAPDETAAPEIKSGYISTPLISPDLEDLVPASGPVAVDAPEGLVEIGVNGNTAFDLDLDGDSETVSVFPFTEAGFYDIVCLRIGRVDGTHTEIFTPLAQCEHAYITSLGENEHSYRILLTGTGTPNHPVTVLYDYAENTITPVPFLENGKASASVSGAAVEIAAGEIVFSRRFDLFGTRWASRLFVFDGSVMSPKEDTVWTFGTFTGDSFEVVGLTLLREITVISGEKVLHVPEGTRVILTSVSDDGTCTLTTEDNVTGSFMPEEIPDTEKHMINGINEDELFLGMIYTD